ncbi:MULTISPECIES: ABC transporter ATP-binding protein [Anaerolinea]|uniref:ABC transporter ATP-binding protein n=1 Tax=Anaerolinea TaxID=233189 RepID=UPI0026EF465F|nr:ABC transporter ATP-binding protein [Anaerolinea thermophila]
MGTVISVEHLSKAYRLGQIGTGTFARDLEVWWAKLRGKPNPLLKIGQEDHGNRDGEIIWALKDVSFTVEQGEVLGIIGRNGAGKSTLLKILSRITAPTEGRVKVKGRIASLLEVGTGFHPELTGRENIYLNGAILGMSRREIDRKFDEIVAFAEIEPFIDTPVKRYSSGMYVRLAFAVAAHLDAEILLVDEVLAVGDAEFQKKCLGKMGEVSSQEGRTVLFVSHNMAAVVNLCPTSIFLENGTIKLREQSSKVIEEYLRVPSVEKIDLNEYRPKWALPYITSVKLVNARGENTDTVPMGSDLIIKVKYSCPQGRHLSKPFLGITIHHASRGTVGGLNTRRVELRRIDRPYHSATLTCVVPHVPLLQGQYTVDIWLGDEPKDVDALMGCLRFSVIEADVYESGRPPDPRIGVVYFHPRWEIEIED